MPVPSSIADLSSTASSNYPSGSESIGTSLDDYLRAHASIIKQVSDAKADSSTAVTLTGTQTVQNKTLDTTNKFSQSAQIGSSETATHNFSIEVPASANGTMKLARGNAGATTQDILTVDASGKVDFPQLSRTLGATGTQGQLEIAGGLIIKFGQVASTNSGATTPVTFTSAFNTAIYAVLTNVQNTGSIVANTNSLSLSGFSCDAWNIAGATRASVIVNWIAIGK